MRNNQPVTGCEKPFTSGIVVTRTNLDGVIEYTNDRFVELSGFSRDELLGQHHNIVRHPDMPPLLFADLWQTIRSGQPWTGLVKNRCKNGDHYWVEAFVLPMEEQGRTVGYMSVRSPATRAQINHAENTYPALKNASALPRPARSAPNEVSVRRAYGVTILGLIAALASLDASLPAIVLAACALAATLGWVVYEQGQIRKLRALIDSCRAIAEGKLNQKITPSGSGISHELAKALSVMQARTKVVADDIQTSAKTLLQSSLQLEKNMHEMETHIGSGSNNVTNISSAIEQLSSSIAQVADNAGNSARISQNARKKLETGSSRLVELEVQSTAFSAQVESARETVASLGGAIGKISMVSNTIHEIAEQTNLLALNAAIEAARAGEYGRGFAVVADEVRKLAERTSQSTGQINQLIASINEETGHAVSKITEVTRQSQESAVAQRDAAADIRGVSHDTDQVDSNMQDIASANIQQSTAATHLAGEMASIAEQFVSSSANLADATCLVSAQAARAQDMSRLADTFKV